MKKSLISLLIAVSMAAAAPSSVLADSAAPGDGAAAESTASQDGVSGESTASQDIFEAKKSGVVFTLPDEFKDTTGAIGFVDYGDAGSNGQGYVQMTASYYPMNREECEILLAEEENAEADGEMDAAAKIVEKLNGKELFGVYGLDGNRGVDDLIDLLIAEFESLKVFYTEEEFEKVAAPEEDWIRSCRYNVLGTKDGFTYILRTGDPELLSNRDPFPGYGDEYYGEFISLLENADLIENNLELTGNIKLTGPFEFATEGKKIEFETTDLEGNPVKSEELFAGHPVTAVNLWATWCNPCKREIPELETLNTELKENNCQIVGIVTDAKKEKKIAQAKEILAELDAGYVNMVPFEGLADLLPQDCWPTTYFVDENGVLIGEPVDYADPDAYREKIEQLLEGEAQLPESGAEASEGGAQVVGEAEASEGEAQLLGSEAEASESEAEASESGAEASEGEPQVHEGRTRMVGGWYIVPNEAEELPEDAQAAFEKATKDLDGAEYTPVALMATQVVAGVNYCILCQITPAVPDAEPAWALVYIYADLQGNAKITNVYELYIAQHSTPKPQQ